MMRLITISILAAGTLAGGWCSAQERNDKDDKTDRDAEMLKSAQRVYFSLLQQARADGLRPADIEQMATWSRRIMGLRFLNTEYWRLQGEIENVPPMVEEAARVLNSSMDKHIERMAKLEQMAQAQVAAGTTSNAAVDAARFHRLNAEALKAKILEMRKQTAANLVLPEPTAADLGPPDLVIDLDRRARLTIDGKLVTKQQLLKRIQAAKTPIKKLEIRADRNVRHDELAKITSMLGEQVEGIRIVVSAEAEEEDEDE